MKDELFSLHNIFQGIAKFYRFFVVKVCTRHYTKSEVSIKDLFSKCDQIRSEEILNGKLHFLSIEEQFAC